MDTNNGLLKIVIRLKTFSRPLLMSKFYFCISLDHSFKNKIEHLIIEVELLLLHAQPTLASMLFQPNCRDAPRKSTLRHQSGHWKNSGNFFSNFKFRFWAIIASEFLWLPEDTHIQLSWLCSPVAVE